MNDKAATGGCLCGAIRYEVSHPPSDAIACHCRRCQRLSGSAFLAGTFYPREHFQLIRGEPRWYESSKIVHRGFCGVCGSQIFSRIMLPEYSETISVSIGSHDDPNSVPVVGHVGVESQQVWLKLDDDLPRQELSDSLVEDALGGKSDGYAAILPGAAR